MKADVKSGLVTLDTRYPIWEHFYTVAPLVVIGTKEGEEYNLAPKHLAMPLGHTNYFGFICTPAHSTWQNILVEKTFTVSFPNPDQVTLASLAASPRCDDPQISKPIVTALPTFKAPHVDALFLRHSYLYLECAVDRIVEGFDGFGLIVGKITGAYVAPESLRVSDSDDDAMIRNAPLLAYLAYGRFAEVKETFSFPMPKGFQV